MWALIDCKIWGTTYQPSQALSDLSRGQRLKLKVNRSHSENTGGFQTVEENPDFKWGRGHLSAFPLSLSHISHQPFDLLWTIPGGSEWRIYSYGVLNRQNCVRSMRIHLSYWTRKRRWRVRWSVYLVLTPWYSIPRRGKPLDRHVTLLTSDQVCQLLVLLPHLILD